MEAKWAAHLPLRQATRLLQEVLPLDQGISLGSTRRKALAVCATLDAQIERESVSALGIVSSSKVTADTRARESTSVGCVSVDSAWLHFSSTPKQRKAARDLRKLMSPWSMTISQTRHVNIVAGRATFVDRAPRVYAYVHKQVSSAAARLDQFLHQSGVRTDERVTVISDDAGEFEKAVAGSRLARSRILDWFHIAMKFQAAERSVRGSKAVDLISSGIAESAVNQVVSHRMEKKQQMRWTDEGAHCLEQVRVADLNGELSVQRLAALARATAANAPNVRRSA